MDDLFCLGPFALLMSVAAYEVLKQKRRIENVPTSRAVAVCFGLTELKGRAHPVGEPLTAPLSGGACTYYSFTVHEWQEVELKEGKKEEKWVYILGDKKTPDFLLRDESGDVRIAPEAAFFHGTVRIDETADSGPLYEKTVERYPGKRARRKFREETIDVGEEVYLIGHAELDEETGQARVTAAPLKKQEVAFHISTHGEESVRRMFLKFGLIIQLIATASWGWAAAVLLNGLGPPWPVIGGIFAALLYLGLTYLVFVANDLKEVRERMRRAFSMIDVDLKRRAELVPNLMRVAEAFMQWEREAMEAFARARPTGGTAEMLAAQSSAVAHIEAHPELRTHEATRDLMKRLEAIESRIAHLREFYNDSVKAYNDRLGMYFDRLVARLLGLAPAEYLTPGS